MFVHQRRALAVAAALISLIVLTIEIPYHVAARQSRAIPDRRHRDSLAVGGFGEATRACGPGANARDSRDESRERFGGPPNAAELQVPLLPQPISGQAVIIEIGGNDML